MSREDLRCLPAADLCQKVRDSVLNSCRNLNMSTIDTVMLHQATQMNRRSILEELLSLKKANVIKNIGVSVQSVSELYPALADNDVSIIQMPFNLLDYRWDEAINDLMAARIERGVQIHARSALFQGLMCSNDSVKWEAAGVSNGNDIVNWLDQKYVQNGKESVADLCIGFVNSQEWIDSVVVGVTSVADLFSNLKSIAAPHLKTEALNDLKNSRPLINRRSLNPTNWSAL